MVSGDGFLGMSDQEEGGGRWQPLEGDEEGPSGTRARRAREEEMREPLGPPSGVNASVQGDAILRMLLPKPLRMMIQLWPYVIGVVLFANLIIVFVLHQVWGQGHAFKMNVIDPANAAFCAVPYDWCAPAPRRSAAPRARGLRARALAFVRLRARSSNCAARERAASSRRAPQVPQRRHLNPGPAARAARGAAPAPLLPARVGQHVLRAARRPLLLHLAPHPRELAADAHAERRPVRPRHRRNDGGLRRGAAAHDALLASAALPEPAGAHRAVQGRVRQRLVVRPGGWPCLSLPASRFQRGAVALWA